jgi:hypothetical protein
MYLQSKTITLWKCGHNTLCKPRATTSSSHLVQVAGGQGPAGNQPTGNTIGVMIDVATKAHKADLAYGTTLTWPHLAISNPVAHHRQ